MRGKRVMPKGTNQQHRYRKRTMLSDVVREDLSRGEDRFLWSRKNSPFEGGKRVLKINECDCKRAATRLASGGKGRGTGEDLRCRPRGRNREGDNLVEEVIRGRACPDEVRIGVGSRGQYSAIRGRRHQPRRHPMKMPNPRGWSRGGPATIFAGNMIEMDDDGDITSYTYDRENRLIEAELPDSTTIEYEYGPEGERLKRYDGTDTIYYVYDGEDVLMELDGSGNVEARYTHVPGDSVGGGSCESCGGEGGTNNVWAIDYPLMMRRSSSNYFYLKDGLGSIVALIDENENVVASYEYDAFGSIVGETSSVWNPYRFTAREYDPDTGDYYYRARTYKPETGRFLQLDPAGMVDGTNMFVYVGNDPINNVDPSGELKCCKKRAWYGKCKKRGKWGFDKPKFQSCSNFASLTTGQGFWCLTAAFNCIWWVVFGPLGITGAIACIIVLCGPGYAVITFYCAISALKCK